MSSQYRMWLWGGRAVLAVSVVLAALPFLVHLDRRDNWALVSAGLLGWTVVWTFVLHWTPRKFTPSQLQLQGDDLVHERRGGVRRVPVARLRRATWRVAVEDGYDVEIVLHTRWRQVRVLCTMPCGHPVLVGVLWRMHTARAGSVPAALLPDAQGVVDTRRSGRTGCLGLVLGLLVEIPRVFVAALVYRAWMVLPILGYLVAAVLAPW